MRRELIRWAVGVLGAALLTTAVVLGMKSDDWVCAFGVCGDAEFRSARVLRSVAQRNAGDAWRNYRQAEVLALVARVVPKAATAGEPFTWFAPDVSPRARSTALTVLADERRASGNARGRAPVAVLFVVDTAKVIGGVDRRGNVLARWSTLAMWPTASSNGWCVAVVKLGPAALANGVTPAPRATLMDACGYYYAFGAPSARLAAALDSGDYRVARGYFPGARDALRREAAFRVPLFDDVSGYRCASGASEACAAYFENVIGAPRRLARRFRPAGMLTPEVAAMTDEQYAETPAAGLFDAFAVTLGTDDFERFWTRNVPPNASYVSAAGEPLTSLARRLAEAQYHRGVVRFGGRLPSPPGDVAADTVLTLAILGALALAALRYGRRPGLT
jgi:hypothetical protein